MFRQCFKVINDCEQWKSLQPNTGYSALVTEGKGQKHSHRREGSPPAMESPSPVLPHVPACSQ